MTTDVKIFLLTEALASDMNATYDPILKNFKEATVLVSPGNPIGIKANNQAGHVVLFDGPNAKGLNFNLTISTLNVSVVAITDSDNRMAL